MTLLLSVILLLSLSIHHQCVILVPGNHQVILVPWRGPRFLDHSDIAWTSQTRSRGPAPASVSTHTDTQAHTHTHTHAVGWRLLRNQ